MEPYHAIDSLEVAEPGVTAPASSSTTRTPLLATSPTSIDQRPPPVQYCEPTSYGTLVGAKHTGVVEGHPSAEVSVVPAMAMSMPPQSESEQRMLAVLHQQQMTIAHMQEEIRMLKTRNPAPDHPIAAPVSQVMVHVDARDAISPLETNDDGSDHDEEAREQARELEQQRKLQAFIEDPLPAAVAGVVSLNSQPSYSACFCAGQSCHAHIAGQKEEISISACTHLHQRCSCCDCACLKELSCLSLFPIFGWMLCCCSRYSHRNLIEMNESNQSVRVHSEAYCTCPCTTLQSARERCCDVCYVTDDILSFNQIADVGIQDDELYALSRVVFLESNEQRLIPASAYTSREAAIQRYLALHRFLYARNSPGVYERVFAKVYKH